MATADLSSLNPRDAVIVAAARTPIGAYQGALAALTAPQLGGVAIRAAVARAGVRPEDIQEVFFGNVCSANLGQAPASQAAAEGGLPHTVPATTINKVCASGMKAVILAAQAILVGDADLLVAGGMESMSGVPYYLPAMRQGARLGHVQAVDGLVKDGLWDPYSDAHMGACAELCAEQFDISREAMDENVISTFERAKAAALAGHTEREIAPVEVPAARRGGGTVVVTQDEALTKIDVAKLRGLRPFFKQEGGSITAGNSSPLSDGACALVVASAARARAERLPALAVVRGYGDANQQPEWFTTAPAAAIPKALARAGLRQDEVDYWEVNQAFSVVDLVNQKILGLDPARVNAHGGAVAFGHPLGATGAVILSRLMSVLHATGGRVGCAAICNGGGGASAVVLEALRQQQGSHI
ncbi:MAG: Thiolase, N-terminal domain-containing protein [Monoraphidium minutum]|nr:MAG: Thiolase, N-terminal domain-containing protein [Monoraphidium minutum]